MITNLLFTALCLALVLVVSSDMLGPREPRRVRIRRGDAGGHRRD